MKTTHHKSPSHHIYAYMCVVLIIIIAGVFVYMKMSYKISPGAAFSGPTKTYTDATYHFSFDYPESFLLSSFDNPSGDGEVILLRTSTTTEQGIQVLVSPFGEPETTALTLDRIHKDVPSMITDNSQEITVGDSGKGVLFMDGVASTSKEQIWFIAKDNLYQVSVSREYVELMNSIISSWKFQ